MQVSYTIYSSYRQFSTPTLKTISVKNFILRQIPTSTFLLRTLFAQEKKFDKKQH